MGTSGTIRKVTLDGLPLFPAADVNVTLNLSPFEIEGIPSSGATMYKMTIRSPNAESIPILAEPVVQDIIRELSERLTSFPMTLTLADNSVYRTVGRINFENVETEENRANIMLIPNRSIGAWELFAAA